MSNVPEDLRYTKEHEWVRVEGGIAVVGVTDHAQHALGDITYTELPKVGAAVRALKPFGLIESVKAANDLYSPVTGKVAAVNDALTDTPEVINKDPYGAGWIIKVQMTDAGELSRLLDAAAYRTLIEKQG